MSLPWPGVLEELARRTQEMRVAYGFIHWYKLIYTHITVIWGNMTERLLIVSCLNECVVVFFFLSLSSSASLWNPPALMAKRFSRFLHEFCAKFSIIIALWHVHIRGYGADMLIKCIGSVLPLSFRISRCHTRHFTPEVFFAPALIGSHVTQNTLGDQIR